MLVGRDFHSHEEQYQTDCKENGQGDKVDINPSRFGKGVEDTQKAGQAKAKDSRALAEDIVNPEEFARLIRRDKLGEIGTGHRLYAALEHTYRDNEDPALPFLAQEYGEHADSGICGNGNKEQFFARHFTGKLTEKQRAREGNELRCKEHDNEFYLVEAEVGAECGCHFNNGMYAVDIEEERNQEQERFSVFLKLAEDRAEAFEGFFYGVFGTGHEILLFVVLQKGQGEE